ncbi:BrnT family toxin [Methylobacterium iners]|uniref:BrnT family toxin n=1 Tax=Methylobacterium iners TaxID=418707 RepID=A0ABQ4RX35_9HYPH|nr:BrnT family toxin [Methylobacterium iners]GJD94804.1 hypothetical protein OCOJLMKI_2010 [Methylobacterium iners]
MIVWDEAKRIANLAKHGLDFAVFEDSFDFETSVNRPARPSRTGRLRTKLIGMLEGRLVVAAIVSPLGTEALAIISLRRASASERMLYEHR